MLDRYITYQKLSLAVRKKVMVSLMYPAVLIVLVMLLMVFLVTYVVPNFAAALHQHAGASCRRMTHDPDRRRHHGAQLHPGRVRRRWSAAIVAVPPVGADASRRGSASTASRCARPIVGEIWLKYQVAQFARVLSTLLTGGIPLVQALETAADSLGTPLLRTRAGAGAARWCAKASRFPASLDAHQDVPAAGAST